MTTITIRNVKSFNDRLDSKYKDLLEKEGFTLSQKNIKVWIPFPDEGEEDYKEEEKDQIALHNITDLLKLIDLVGCRVIVSSKEIVLYDGYTE